MSTTASEIRGMSATSFYVDEWSSETYSQSHLPDLYPSPNDYRMVKIGRKEYGFEPRNKAGVGSGLVARYKCSHLEAQRRFAMMLVTRKMMR